MVTFHLWFTGVSEMTLNEVDKGFYFGEEARDEDEVVRRKVKTEKDTGDLVPLPFNGETVTKCG